MGVERGPFSPLFSSYDPFSSRFIVGFCHLQTHLTASLRGQNVLGGEALLLCSIFTCLQHPILLYYTCCIKTGTTENLPPSPTTRVSLHMVREHQDVILTQTQPQEDSFMCLYKQKNVSPCSLEEVYRHFGRTYSIHLQEKQSNQNAFLHSVKSIRSTISFATVSILWSSGRVIAQRNVAAGHQRFEAKYSLHPQGTK